MKLQLKISLLFATLLGVLILSFMSYQYLRIHQDKLLYLENEKTQELMIDKVIQLKKEKCEQLVKDNSGWDDMVKFAAHPDLKWAKDNVDFLVNSFNLSFVLVYNKEMKLVYQYTQYGDSSCLKLFDYPDPEMIQSTFQLTKFLHRYQVCGKNLVELFGATIVPSNDIDLRETTPQGYLFIGTEWNKHYLSDFSQVTNFQVELLSGFGAEEQKNDLSKSYIIRTFSDHQGKPLVSLMFSRRNPAKRDLTVFLYLSILVALFALVSMIVFLFYFRRIVLIPLTKISNALNADNPEEIMSLKSNTEEFKNLGDLVLQFFWQEEILKKNNADLQESNATKDKLFSIVGHDLKNPIGNVLVVSGLLAESIKQQDFETAEELRSMIETQAKETLNLLETLLDWAKSQTGRMNIKPEVLKLKPVTDQVLRNLNTLSALKNISIESDLSEDLEVYSDANVLNTVLRNLITNAIKFTNPWGTISITAEMNNYCTEITVSDNGVGMDKEKLEKLFKVNTDIISRGTANEKGTGLGLIICKEFVEKHGGRIHVTSKPGVGSQFKIVFPSADGFILQESIDSGVENSD